MKIAAHIIAIIHLCAIASDTVFNLAHLLAVASNAVVAAFSKLLQFGFAISITSNRYTGRGLFMDPPSVFMSNNTWSLLLPEGFQIENLKLAFASRDKNVI
ncbi:Bifunctional dethiobiotin synthetase/7,8-diamino-pelargonic acid aminotransferase [Arachis hypogaea]|nr:Bifunctional dethiobiotin synthetase/7,8-diamino-pelargonic acid aminotransferase [Arachis hypogaea]